ncbi:protein of unknown function (plasmid) [Caballeronia sp. S22]
MPIVVIFMVGAPLVQVVALTLPLWHIDAVSGGGVHSIRFDNTLGDTPEVSPQRHWRTLAILAIFHGKP